ncbi:energy transducer TonB [Tenacibaculum sp. SG-28]|uniref:energy transducer TonB n=1 Tax=Tenacibaculum sp. SG-28 TaxID=754426 RepID=UPI000CF41DCD|nr:energy transducer TonB [Tenacibaculum sp. SG-28]PQJ23064.1 hypothetical protein BSU00_02045 [Tenacibaculum sp. SG-28]
MKKRIVLLLLFSLSVLSICSQENCTEPTEEELIDLNTIVINKCEVEEKKKTNTPKRNVLRTKKSLRRRVTNRISTKANKINKNIPTTDAPIPDIITDDKLQVENVLFEVVENVPEVPNCKNSDIEDKRKCFKNEIHNHFEKNFNPENIIDDEIKGKFIIKFNISIYGKIKDIEVLSKKRSKKLDKEIFRIFGKLKDIEPGTINGLPIEVTYVFPLHLTI